MQLKYYIFPYPQLEDLLNRISDLESDCRKLIEENELLRIENKELRNRLGLTSENSSKPPSSDGLRKKTTSTGLPKADSTKKVGGQPEHQGHTLKAVLNPDVRITHLPEKCVCCGKTFTIEDLLSHTNQKRQVFDLPAPQLIVTEHLLGIVSCCNQEQIATFPSHIQAPVQYGTGIQALSVVLSTEYCMPYEKITTLFKVLFNCQFNESTAVKYNEKCYTLLENIEQEIIAQIISSEITHADETGLRVENKLHWLHTTSTKDWTYLLMHPKRGKEALWSESSILGRLTNWLIHDCWKSYFDFIGVKHGICNAHILRELSNLKENGSLWAIEMHTFLLELYKISEKASLIVPNKEDWYEKYRIILQNADKEEPAEIKKIRGRPYNTKGRNLLNRLEKYQDGVLAFAFNINVPFSNNQAERDIRCVKIKQKMAMAFRTFKGPSIYARIKGFISSCIKQNKNYFLEIKNVFEKIAVFGVIPK